MGGGEGPVGTPQQSMAASMLGILPQKASPVPAGDGTAEMEAEVCAVQRHRSFCHLGVVLLGKVWVKCTLLLCAQESLHGSVCSCLFQLPKVFRQNKKHDSV